jgi:hypothetical protein
MANISQTAANVKPVGTAPKIQVFIAGEGLTQGQPFYVLSTDNRAYKSDANVAAAAKCQGIALTPASTGEAVIGALPGSQVNLGATLTTGETYAVANTAGAICPVADLTTGDYPVLLDVAISTSVLQFNVIEGTVAK